ncbi:MAG: GAF domain-containing protein [Anaerolineae bacterium]|nr:GAF domain-containing protein [Anaerolineae bacterium]
MDAPLPDTFSQPAAPAAELLRDPRPPPNSPVADTPLEAARRLERRQQAALAILSAPAPATAINLAVNYIEETIDCLAAGISLYSASPETMTVLQDSHDGWEPGARIPVTRDDVLATVAAGDLYYLADLRAAAGGSPGFQHAVGLGGRSLLAAPVSIDGQLLGVLWLITATPRPFSADEETVAREVARVVAVALNNRRLLAAEQQARARERSLREVGASLTLGLSRGAVLKRILEQLGQLVPFASAAIVLLDGGEIVFAATHEQAPRPEQIDDLRRHTPVTLRALVDSCQPRVIDDTTKAPDWDALPGFSYIRAWLGVPLLYNGVCIGALTIDREQPHSFSAADMELAMAFANQAAVAIENARLFNAVQSHAEQLEERVRERTRELEALYGISAATIEQPELASVLARALELVVRAFDCPAAAVHLIQPGRPEHQPIAQLDRSGGRLAGFLGDPRVGALLRERALAGATDITGGELAAALGGDWPQAVAVAPLRARGRNLGVLSLWSDVAGAFAGATRFLTAVADQLGAAVENLQLRQMTRQAAVLEERERVARELHDAVTQTVYSAGLFAEAARESARAGDLAAVEHHTQTIVQRVSQALREMRLLLFELRADALAQRGLAAALRDRLQSVEERANIATRFSVAGVGELPPALEEAFYRVALEALNNALHHSRAGRVIVTLRAAGGELILVVRDDGAGFRRRDAAAGGGMGLESMARRMDKIGGRLRIASRPGRGTRVEARAPLPARPPEANER